MAVKPRSTSLRRSRVHREGTSLRWSLDILAPNNLRLNGGCPILERVLLWNGCLLLPGTLGGAADGFDPSFDCLVYGARIIPHFAELAWEVLAYGKVGMLTGCTRFLVEFKLARRGCESCAKVVPPATVLSGAKDRRPGVGRSGNGKPLAGDELVNLIIHRDSEQAALPRLWANQNEVLMRRSSFTPAGAPPHGFFNRPPRVQSRKRAQGFGALWSRAGGFLWDLPASYIQPDVHEHAPSRGIDHVRSRRFDQGRGFARLPPVRSIRRSVLPSRRSA